MVDARAPWSTQHNRGTTDAVSERLPENLLHVCFVLVRQDAAKLALVFLYFSPFLVLERSFVSSAYKWGTGWRLSLLTASSLFLSQLVLVRLPRLVMAAPMLFQWMCRWLQTTYCQTAPMLFQQLCRRVLTACSRAASGAAAEFLLRTSLSLFPILSCSAFWLPSLQSAASGPLEGLLRGVEAGGDKWESMAPLNVDFVFFHFIISCILFTNIILYTQGCFNVRISQFLQQLPWTQILMLVAKNILILFFYKLQILQNNLCCWFKSKERNKQKQIN